MQHSILFSVCEVHFHEVLVLITPLAAWVLADYTSDKLDLALSSTYREYVQHRLLPESD